MMGHINLNVRLKFVSLSALFAKTQALYLRGKWWNKTLNYGTPQVFNLHVGLCKKKKMRKKFLKGNVFVEYGPVQGSWLPCFGWRDNSALLVFAPFFNRNVFSLSLRWPCFGWGEGEVGRRGEGTSTLLVFVQAPRVTNWFTAVDDNIKRRLMEENGRKCMIC